MSICNAVRETQFIQCSLPIYRDTNSSLGQMRYTYHKHHTESTCPPMEYHLKSNTLAIQIRNVT